MFLTIAIPTFNRNEVLFHNIQSLLPQINARCSLLVIDNCSDLPVKTTLGSVLNMYPDKNIRILRNSSNIGAGANVLRCIEEAEGEYIWILADDDTPTATAIDSIFEITKNQPDFVNFYCPHPQHPIRNKDINGEGIEQLLSQVDSFGNLILISNLVIKKKSASTLLRYGHHYAGTCGPHVALMLMLASQGGNWSLSNQVLVEKGEPEEHQKFSILPVMRGLPALAWLLVPAHRPKFRKILLGSTESWLPPRAVVAQLVLCESTDDTFLDIDNFLEYHTIRHLWHAGMAWSLSNLKWWCWSLPLLFPYLARKLLQMYAIWKNKNILALDAKGTRL